MWKKADLKEKLEAIYASYNRREYVRPDPLQFLYEYERPEDQEIVGLICSTLAYGRVEQIVRSCRGALKPLGPRPKETLLGATSKELCSMYSGFKHRFHGGGQMALLLRNIGLLIIEHGSLGRALKGYVENEDGDLVKGLSGFVTSLSNGNEGHCSLLPDPRKGSACKRLFLYLRWMVRRDEVDLGCWTGLFSPKDLLVPLDTHLFSIGRVLGFTSRKTPDLKAAQEVTSGFRRLSPHDPVKYDFSLTRFGISPRFSKEELLCLLESS